MDEYCKTNGFVDWFETSAKENINIDEAARALINRVTSRHNLTLALSQIFIVLYLIVDFTK